MTLETFENICLTAGIGALILFMLFIVYDLARRSGAGKYGSLVLFTALGLGFVSFAAKAVITEALGM